jgi:Uma2 family endonuclease
VDPPPAVEDLIAERHALGQDLYDEVWEGEYHVAAAPTGTHADLQAQLIQVLGPMARSAGLHIVGPTNIGRPGDFRVPDLVVLRGARDVTWNPTAAIVVEVVSPGDESRRKLDFYFGAGVEELLTVEPELGTLEWFARAADGFEPAVGSALLGTTSADLATSIDWPTVSPSQWSGV